MTSALTRWLSARPPSTLARMLCAYPPYLGAGIRVRFEDGGFVVRMGLHPWNRNVVGTQFGGSLYSMCDPFFMLLLMRALGPDFTVWDKAATIRFRRPGRGPVEARFFLPEDEIERVRRLALAGETVEPVYVAEVLADDGTRVAVVEKHLHVRHRPNDTTPSSG